MLLEKQALSKSEPTLDIHVTVQFRYALPIRNFAPPLLKQ